MKIQDVVQNDLQKNGSTTRMKEMLYWHICEDLFAMGSLLDPNSKVAKVTNQLGDQVGNDLNILESHGCWDSLLIVLLLQTHSSQ